MWYARVGIESNTSDYGYQRTWQSSTCVKVMDPTEENDLILKECATSKDNTYLSSSGYVAFVLSINNLVIA
jgi:hypothetical protein